ncbi:MAG: Com family DNA-binding transcriptional regulator [Proteobacteria bacterium]|nr:Com family DNA-binding transcriptional regulator [Pseudomonadota bacterium]
MKHKTENRCRSCKKLLFKGTPGHIEIKCPRCGSIIIYSEPPEGQNQQQNGGKTWLNGQ